MTRSCINICLLAVISLLFGVIWQGSAYAAMPVIQPLGSITNGMSTPGRVALDGAGNLYVANLGAKNIVKYDKFGSLVATFDAVQVSGYGLAVSEDGNTIYASAADKVVVLDGSGALQGYLGSGAGQFLDAGNIAIGLAGEVLVGDIVARVVKVFPTGGGVTQLSGVNFGGVVDIDVDPVSGEIYVGDPVFEGAQTPQLYVFSPSYSLVRQLDAATAFGPTRLQWFGGLAFDDAGRLYAADAESGELRIIELPATYLGTYSNAGKMDRPDSIVYEKSAVAGVGRLYAVWAANRVDVYGVDGGVSPVPANTPPTVPVPVTAGEVGSATPGLVFNNASDADGDTLSYNVRVLDGATVVTSFSVASGATQTTAIVDVVLTENASYTWQVQADDGTDTSAWCALQPIYVNAVQEAPSAPLLISLFAGGDAGGAAILTWNGSSDADPNASLSYRVEILEGASQVASGNYASTSATLAGLSASLTPGTSYSWRVVAVDNTALETPSSNTDTFVYQPSVLQISANVDGAQVYLGGHHGFAGRLLGTAPVSVRDLATGSYSVVVEAAGFQPYVASVDVIADTQVNVAATLKGARLATGYAQHGLNLNGAAVTTADAAIVADIDRDGIIDLLLAAGGQLSVYAGSMATDPQAVDTIEALDAQTGVDRVVFASAAQPLAVAQTTGAVPCLVDWNNDDNFDLLIGAGDGSVKLYLGQGGLSFSAVADEWLTTVSAQAIPAVADVNGDGLKDLVVAAGNELLLFANVGSDAAPLLGTQTTMANLTAPAVPVFADWNADGSRELMLLSQGELFEATLSGETVTGLVSTGLVVTDAASVFALNTAGGSYTDLVFATNAGALVAANGQQGGFAPAYQDAVLVKLAEVEQAVLNQDPAQLDKVSSITSRIGRGKYDAAAWKAEQLAIELGLETPAGIVVTELVNILN